MNYESPKWGRGALDVEVIDDGSAVRRRRRNLIIGVALALVLIIAALAILGVGKKPSKQAQAAAAAGQKSRGGPAPRVTVTVPGRQAIAKTITATGTIAARRDMPVGVPGEGGMVVKVMVEPGQWVGAGQTLAVIERSVQSQQAAQQAAQIQVAEADARLAQSNLARAESLVSRGFISKADLDTKRATRDAAAARVRVARATLGETQARIGRLSVRAPAAGLVLSRNVEAGQVVGPGSGALFHIAEGGQMEVQARLSDQDLVNVHAGLPATVNPTGTSINITGQVWQVSPLVDPSSRQGIARVAIPYQAVLRPGAFASVTLTAGAATLPLLPQSAVLSDDKGSFVYIVAPDNTVQKRAVTVGQVDDRGVSISAGLAGDERVVVSAGAFLNPNDKVIPVREAAR
ncbi:MAG: efflux RND transporter periplasmic adaptor subunit [Alphaproteobacteria bacterium]|nr:efflux RND transporter periplasmic adaptor subunit [Alphaproteobacteria bacterium]